VSWKIVLKMSGSILILSLSLTWLPSGVRFTGRLNTVLGQIWRSIIPLKGLRIWRVVKTHFLGFLAIVLSGMADLIVLTLGGSPVARRADVRSIGAKGRTSVII
jgi:hypothetical protein